MKNFTVSTYIELKRFIKDMSVDSTCLYVMASSSLASYMKYCPQFVSHKQNVWTYEQFQNALYPEYYNVKNEWKMKTILRSTIEEKCPSDLQSKLMIHIEDIYFLFQFYLLSGIWKVNSDFVSDRRQKVIRELYNIWSNHDYIQQIYRKRITHDQKEITERLNKCYQENWAKSKVDEYRPIPTVKKISFINITFFDAPRFYFMKQLQKAGIEINFIIPRSGYQDPWKKTYGFIPTRNYTAFQMSHEEKTNRYIEYLKGNGVVSEIEHSNVSIKTYENSLEFKQQLKQAPLFQSQKQYESWAQKNGTNAIGNFKKVREYITFSKEEYNSLFNGVILDYNHKNKHYFNHISGKFLESLYELSWNETETDINMSYETFRNIMLSGWVEMKKGGSIVNAFNCYDIFADLEPYMKGVKSYREIISRIEKVIYLQEFSSVFTETAKDKTNGDQVLEYLQNPLKVLPYTDNTRFSVTIKQLYDLSKKLFSIIEVLIPKNNRIVLNTHIRALGDLWLSISYNKQFMKVYNELRYNRESKEFKEFSEKHKLEIAVAKCFKIMLADSDGEEYTLEEVKQFIQINTKIFRKSNDEELDVNDMGDNLIKSFIQLEGIGINDTKEIFISDLSEKSIAQYASPSKFGSLDGQIEVFKYDLLASNLSYAKDELKIIFDQINITRETKVSYIKYYIGTVINNDKCKVEFSYIKDIRENDQESSIFKILRVLFADKIDNRKYSSTRYEFQNTCIEEKVDRGVSYEHIPLALVENELNTTIKEKISPVGWLDLDYCPKKFYYSNILSFHPVYTEEFQQRLVFAALGKLLKSQHKNSGETQKYFYYLFPQWNRTLKDNMVDTTFPQSIREDVQFRNVKFPYDMKALQLLRSGRYYNTRTKRMKTYKERENRAELYFSEFVKNELFSYSVKHLSGPFCNMCPHKMICTKGEFPVERYTNR